MKVRVQSVLFFFFNSFLFRHVPLHMQYYMLSFTLHTRFLWFPSFGRILHIQLFLFCSFISLWLSFLFRLEPLCLHKTSKLMEFTNF